MKVAYLDCVAGISGDMLLSAVVDAGAPPEAVQEVIPALGLKGCALEFERVMKNGISSLHAVVTTPHHHEHRHLSHLLEIVAAGKIPEDIKTKARDILLRLGKVEAGIHNAPLESVHLHEVGGDDTLIDVVGALLGLKALGVEEIYASALPLGKGWIDCAHGRLPLPAPATLALLKDVPVQYVDIEAELVTPTGAVLVTSLATQFDFFPPMTVRKVGYGAGTWDLKIPNVLRLWLGDTSPEKNGLIIENLVLVETNIDDLNPQAYAYVMDRLFAAGALDVVFIPVSMKKNRPAVMLSALCQMDHVDQISQIFFTETTTLGVRQQVIKRVCLPRTFETVETPYGAIRVKIGHWQGGERRMPEFEDCRQAAEKHNVPLIDVIEVAKRVGIPQS